MHILVTGGSGFIGSAFVRTARDAGHELALLSRQVSADKDFRASGGPAPTSEVSVLQGSLAEPPWSAIEKFAPEACVHAAWIATPGVYLESPENHDWVRWSREFLTRLPACGVRHIVALGTCIEYEITGQPLQEDLTPLAPTSTYARCKHELHGQLRVALATSAVPLAWARIFYPYGEGEHPARLASSLLAKFHAGEPVTLKTPRSVKDYVHVADVASALLTLVERRFDGTVNVGTGEGVTVESIARQLAEMVGRPELVRVPEVTVTDPLDLVVADAMRLHSLGWHPQVTLAAGLRRLVEARRQ
jgi:dTDP-6-deoxy-L-talose 4-dehydrogenase (NAD+)